MKVTFTVDRIDERPVNTKFGAKKAYDLYAKDGTKYGFGFTAPNRVGIAVGSEVTGEATNGSYGMTLDAKSVVVGGASGPTLTTPSASAPSGGYKAPTGGGYGRADKVFPVPATHGDMAIIRQNALTNSVSCVADFIATQPSEKWPDLPTWRQMVIETAYEFAKFSSGHRELEAVSNLRKAGVEAAEIHSAIEAHNAEVE